MTTSVTSRSIGAWVQGARPRTLILSITPIAVGLAYAIAVYGSAAPAPILAALASAISIQIATNLANDSADGGRGADGAGRLGPMRLVGAGLKSAAQVRRGAAVASLAAAVFGLVAVIHGGWPILVVGIASLLAAWGYSYGPAPISASALGELFVVGFFGVVATVGIVWLCVHRADPTAVLLGVAIGLPAAAVLTVNNHRDRVQDIASGRRTLAIRLGPVATPYIYTLELVAAAALAGVALWPISRLGVLVAVVALGVALRLGHTLSRTPVSRALNDTLAATVRFQIGLAAGVVAVLALAAR